MARLHVTCITKHPTHTDRHHRIQSIGGAGWKHTESNAIANIENGTNSYYTTGGGLTAEVIVATHFSGKKYLKTTADTTTKDNLLSLPEC
jgi:hypothetical protein